MKLLTLIAFASLAATAAPAFADSIVPGSDAAFYSQATPAHSTTSTTRYGMPHTAALNAAQPGSNSDLVPGSDAAFLSTASKAGSPQDRSAHATTSIAPSMVPGSGAAFLN